MLIEILGNAIAYVTVTNVGNVEAERTESGSPTICDIVGEVRSR